MSTKIDINDIIDANSHNSAMGLTADWAKYFRLYALEEYEDISDDPANSFNVFLHLTAQGAAKMMYEQQARINETNVSTAILPKSLLNKLSSDDLLGIFGTPASTTLAFCIKKDDIIQYSVYDSSDDAYKLVINKNMKITFESHPEFTLPYDVIISCKHNTYNDLDKDTGETIQKTEYNIYGYYDMPSNTNDGMRSIYNINNQYISSREMRFDGETYIAFFIKIFQMERKEIEFYVSDPFTSDTSIDFNNLLIGVEVFRKRSGSKTESLMKGLIEGESLVQNSYNYSYDYKRNSNNFNISFSKMNDLTALSVGDTIRAIVYTTQGKKGNIDFPYMIYNINNLNVEYSQDLSISSQNAVLNTTALAFARDQSSVGGTDSLTFEEIRSKIISKMYSRDILISNNEIINKGAELGLNIKRVEQDLISMYYQSNDVISYKDMILSSGTDSFYFKMTDKDRIVSTYNYYMIEPTDVFKFDKKRKRLNYIKPFDINDTSSEKTELYNEYVNKYNSATTKEDVLEAVFPFYIRYENTKNPKIQIYDMFIDSIEYLSFTKYDEPYALDKLDISSIKIVRNPYRSYNNGNFDKNVSNQYVIQFIVYTGENTLNKLKLQSGNANRSLNYVNSSDETDYFKQYVTFEVSMTGINNNVKNVIKPTNVQIINVDTMVKDGYIAYQAYFETNNFINDSKQLSIKGVKPATTLLNDYTSYVGVDSSVKFKIIGKFNDYTNNPLNKECIEYESDTVELVKYLTDNFNINFDIEVDAPKYETYKTIKPYIYDSFKRIKNPDYDSENTNIFDPNHYEFLVETSNNEVIMNIKTNSSIPTPTYLYAHEKGDIVFDYVELTSEEYNEGPIANKEYYIYYGKDEDDEKIYQKVSINYNDGFEEGRKYYTAHQRIKHHIGDLIYYNKVTGEEADDIVSPDDVNYVLKPLPTTYTAICKNVPWINRLYLAGESMYKKVVDMYYDIIDRTSKVRNMLFDGGKIFIGLYNTSGKSSKFMAYKLNTNSREYLNDLALSISYKVKYLSSENVDYKNELIKTATVNYIKNIGSSNFSVDKLFEEIKNFVPDIEYINIININNYKNGEVQTILNDTSIVDEILTVSQKITTDENGDIDFEPDISIDVVQVDL